MKLIVSAMGVDEPTMTVLLLALATVAMVVVYIMMALMKKSKIKKLKESVDPKEEAYNQIQMLKSMVRIMGDKNYDVSSVESMVEKAQKAYDMENYAECTEIVNNAKRILVRLRNETVVEDNVSPQVAREMEIIKKIDEGEQKGELPTPLRELEKDLPENFLQSKFEIKVVERKIVDYEEGEVKEAAVLYLTKAKRAFDNREYTEALRFAIKSNRILETGEIPQERTIKNVVPKIEPPKHGVVPIVEEEPEKEEELRCQNCGAVVRPEDKFCWNCGAKLEFKYKCPNCGAEVSSEDKFCRNCGYKLK